MRVPVSEDEQLRLDNCAAESIRVPGAIQPHGALLTVGLESLLVLQASSNAERVLGVGAEALVGTALSRLVGPGAVDQCLAIFEGRGLAANPVAVHINSTSFDVLVHQADGVGIVEFEPLRNEEASAATIHSAIHRLSDAGTVGDTYARAASEMSRLTGFERVVVYKFHEDGHGEVVAEEVAAGLEPYLGLHFPASDIPAQARLLYQSKRTRVIVLSEDAPADLVPEHNPVASAPLDLGHAELRSVSPHHVEFMKNMGQTTTISLSLVHGDRLIGMITCSHGTPVYTPYLVRQGYEVLARQVSLQLGAAAEVERLTRLDTVRSVRTRLARQVETESDVKVALSKGEFTLLDLITADGATLRHRGVSTSIADAPDVVIGPDMLEELTESHQTVVVSDALSVDYPRLHAIMPDIAGVLIMPFGVDGDYLAWFRKETLFTVNWLGDQTPANRATSLSPRTSFETWSESVEGRSEPWDQLALLEATELRHDLNTVLLRLAESELARIALHDPLTGLPNRRLLSDRMDQALAKRGRGTPVALLFADLDSFKQINDTDGHGVGDAVIVAAAERIRSVVRREDTVARIGGDEFVVLCEDAGADEGNATAARILDIFSTPLVVAGHEHRVGVSIGMAFAELGQSADELLHAADEAMYRAKKGGRGRVSE